MFDIIERCGYSWCKSLEPLFVTRKPAPVRRGFFTPVVRLDCERPRQLWPGGRQLYNTRKGKSAYRGDAGSNLPAAFMLIAANPIRTGVVTMKSPKAAAPFAQQSIVSLHRLIKCRVEVTTAHGARHRYVALFRSTCGAVMDAFDRFGIAKVNVEAIKSQEKGGAA